ncbi:hypothetical protein AVEN_271833-1 [Araneus ventricosus]|uniref:Uncharacterized protein n=1 Tax=Araneus ventricosus TaxID=182803 RepID=A0A4Y1ZXG6_ARAVE|nr:hypothetical protein AVEN_271833-1 [Araneus ventricosus]
MLLVRRLLGSVYRLIDLILVTRSPSSLPPFHIEKIQWGFVNRITYGPLLSVRFATPLQIWAFCLFGLFAVMREGRAKANDCAIKAAVDARSGPFRLGNDWCDAL